MITANPHSTVCYAGCAQFVYETRGILYVYVPMILKRSVFVIRVPIKVDYITSLMTGIMFVAFKT